jgi:hypothetical protein
MRARVQVRQPRPRGFTSCSFTVTERPVCAQEELEAPHQLCQPSNEEIGISPINLVAENSEWLLRPSPSPPNDTNPGL